MFPQLNACHLHSSFEVTIEADSIEVLVTVRTAVVNDALAVPTREELQICGIISKVVKMSHLSQIF